MVEIYAINITKNTSDEYKNCLLLVSDEQRKKISRFHFPDDAKRSLFGEVLVRYLASVKLGIKNSNILIEKNEFGKPYLAVQNPFQYNISHSGNWVICAIDSNNVGVDIEQIKPIDLTIAKRFFTPREYQTIFEKCDQEQLKAFYTYWTLKESYIKFVGKGLSIPLKAVSFIEEGNTYKLKHDKYGLKFFTKRFLYDYVLSLSYLETNMISEIREVSISELLIAKGFK